MKVALGFSEMSLSITTQHMPEDLHSQIADVLPFCLTQQPNAAQGRLIVEVSKSPSDTAQSVGHIWRRKCCVRFHWHNYESTWWESKGNCLNQLRSMNTPHYRDSHRKCVQSACHKSFSHRNPFQIECPVTWISSSSLQNPLQNININFSRCCPIIPNSGF
jgi:hypothetical protein